MRSNTLLTRQEEICWLNRVYKHQLSPHIVTIDHPERQSPTRNEKPHDRKYNKKKILNICDPRHLNSCHKRICEEIFQKNVISYEAFYTAGCCCVNIKVGEFFTTLNISSCSAFIVVQDFLSYLMGERKRRRERKSQGTHFYSENAAIFSA